MKKFMKKFGLLLTVVAIATTSVLALTACNNSNQKDPDTLYVATNAEFPPFEYLENGKPTGFDIDFANALAKEMGYKNGAKILDMKFEALVGSVKAGQADVAIAGLTIDPEKDASFSNPYFQAAQVVIYKGAEQTFNSEEVLIKFLNNKKVGVCLGYSGSKLLDGYIADKKVTGVTPVVSDNGALAIQNLKGGLVDVVIIDQVPAQKLVASAGDSTMKITIQTLGKEEYGVMCKKGNTAMVDKVNAAIEALKTKKAEGSDLTIYETIYNKYFKIDK